MSYMSRATSTRLVGSILYADSTVSEDAQGYALMTEGEKPSDTGPTTSDGQMIDSAFSRCSVRRRPEALCRDSTEE